MKTDPNEKLDRLNKQKRQQFTYGVTPIQYVTNSHQNYVEHDIKNFAQGDSKKTSLLTK